MHPIADNHRYVVIVRWIFAVFGIGSVAGCGHGPRSVSDPDPAEKIPAIEHAARIGDRTSIPQLVTDLDSDDSAVRFYAIDALRKFTGEDRGYRYYDDGDQRKPAIIRWRQWLATQKIQ